MKTIEEVDLHLTNSCMLSCKHCCFDAGRPLRRELPLSRWYQVLEDAKEIGAVKVDLTGGEPLVLPYLESIISHATQLDFDVTLQTNGVLLDSPRRAKLRQAGLCDVMVSIDGWQESHDRLRQKKIFTSVKSNVEQAVSEGFRVRVNATAMRSTVGGILELIRWADSVGVNMVSVFYFTAQGRGAAIKTEEIPPDEWSSAVAILKELAHHTSSTRVIVEAAFGPLGFSLTDHPCPMLDRGYLQILADGRAYPCTMLIFSDLYVADVSRESLTVVREQNRWNQLIQEYNAAISTGGRHTTGCIGYSTWQTGKLGSDPRWRQVNKGKTFPICPLIKVDLGTKVSALRSSLLRG